MRVCKSYQNAYYVVAMRLIYKVFDQRHNRIIIPHPQNRPCHIWTRSVCVNVVDLSVKFRVTYGIQWIFAWLPLSRGTLYTAGRLCTQPCKVKTHSRTQRGQDGGRFWHRFDIEHSGFYFLKVCCSPFLSITSFNSRMQPCVVTLYYLAQSRNTVWWIALSKMKARRYATSALWCASPCFRPGNAQRGRRALIQ